MDIKKHQEFIKAYQATYQGLSQSEHEICVVLGIIGELGELTEASSRLRVNVEDVAEELGDVYAYLSIIATDLDIDIDNIYIPVTVPEPCLKDLDQCLLELISAIGSFCELYKKCIRDKKSSHHANRTKYIDKFIRILINFDLVSNCLGMNLEEILELNHLKLTKRIK